MLRRPAPQRACDEGGGERVTRTDGVDDLNREPRHLAGGSASDDGTAIAAPGDDGCADVEAITDRRRELRRIPAAGIQQRGQQVQLVVVQLQDVGLPERSFDPGSIVELLPQVDVVDDQGVIRRRRQAGVNRLARGLAPLCQRSKADRGGRSHRRQQLVRHLHGVPGHAFVDDVRRVSTLGEVNGHTAGRFGFIALHQSDVDLPSAQKLQEFIARAIDADPRCQPSDVPQLAGVIGEVRRRTARPAGIGKLVPQHFTKANHNRLLHDLSAH
ncbi:MAG: hypothetical protein R3B90_00575 [Planctomycetaceae bacterium]